MNKQAANASCQTLGLCACHSCGLVSRLPENLPKSHQHYCPRCESKLHVRKTKSIYHTWIYLITSFILYVPANVLPIMDTSSLFGSQRDTIMSGIIYLWKSGSWLTALVVLIASIITPLFKMLALTWLLITVHYSANNKPAWMPHFNPRSRTSLYRFLDAIGRWSMLDIFMVSLLVTLVQLKSLSVITASPGAIAFAAVVVMTMLAVHSFDPRLIWDSIESNSEAHNLSKLDPIDSLDLVNKLNPGK